MNKFPKVIFSYNAEKDKENIKIGLETVRKGRNPDPELNKIIDLYGNNPQDEEILSFLENWWKDKELIKETIIKQLQEYWDSIEEIFFNRLSEKIEIEENFYEIKKIDGFLSIRYGSGFNSKENWFAVSVQNGSLSNARVAMHEIMHIFFNKGWVGFCREELKLKEKEIWDIREAMTVLLNSWFKNLLINLDLGYPEHTELRRKIIREWWPENKDFKKIIILASRYMKENQEKSPVWNK